MVTGFGWFTLTRLTGLIAYLVCGLACGARWQRCRKEDKGGGLFGVLAAVQGILLLDMAFDWRWKLHDYWVHEAIARGLYEERRWPQMVAIGTVVAVSGLACALALYLLRRRIGLAVATAGTMASVGLTGCELISYHALDRWLYHYLGPVMAITLLWAAIALITCAGVWRDSQNKTFL